VRPSTVAVTGFPFTVRLTVFCIRHLPASSIPVAAVAAGRSFVPAPLRVKPLARDRGVTVSTAPQAALDERSECAGAMADLVFFGRLHLAKGLDPTFGHKHRVIAKTALAARRPDQRAGNLAAEKFHMLVGPAESQHRDEARAAVAVGEVPVHPFH